jgi:hypothetical protein
MERFVLHQSDDDLARLLRAQSHSLRSPGRGGFVLDLVDVSVMGTHDRREGTRYAQHF